MAAQSTDDATRIYLDYLDKEMTIQGVLAAFCVAVSAAAFDRVLGADPKAASSLILDIQGFSYLYVLAAIASLILAALFFYLQRSYLAWLYGALSLTIAREAHGIGTPTAVSSVGQGLEIGDSWSLWNRYKFGLSFLTATAAEIVLAVLIAILKTNASKAHSIMAAAIPIALATAVNIAIFCAMSKRDKDLA